MGEIIIFKKEKLEQKFYSKALQKICSVLNYAV